MTTSTGRCPYCGASNEPHAARCAACGQVLLPVTPPQGVSRRAAIAKGVAIAAGVALLPIGGLAAYAACEKSNDPLLYTFNEENINAVAWSPDSTLVASASFTGAQIWEAATGKRVRRMQTHESLDDVHWSADGRRLLTLQQKLTAPNASSFIETVEVWDAATGKRLQSLPLTEPGYTGYVAIGLNEPNLAVNREIRAEDQAAAGSQSLQGKVIEIWDVGAGRMVAAFSGFPGRFVDPSGQMIWAPDRRRLAVVYNDRNIATVEVEILDAVARQRIASFPIQRPTNVPPSPPRLPVAWSPDGRRLAVATINRGPGLYASATNALFLLDPSTGQQLAHYGIGNSVLGLDIAFSPNSRYFLLTTSNGVEMWRSS